MKQLLDEQAVVILQSRVYLSRITRLFTFEDLAKDWGMTKTTLYRYISPAYREYSRKEARAAWEIQKKVDRTKCQICKKTLKGHARCPFCTILFHGKKCDCGSRIALLREDKIKYYRTNA